MINQYKRTDVYRCKLQSHESFAGWVSVYHVLEVKKCLPDGCIYFKWHCRLLDKGARCRKGYTSPGRNCQGCRFFVDEKIHKVPVLMLSEKEHGRFKLELEEFEQWLRDNLGRRLEVYGRVNSVSPLLRRDICHDRSRLSQRGFLVNFAESYLGRTHVEDYVYLRLGAKAQARLELCRGDLLEFNAELTLDNGRLVLVRPRSIEVEERSPGRTVSSEVPFDTRRARLIEDQSERCINCERGRLVDVVHHGRTGGGAKINRQLFCLEGISEPELCCYQALKELGIRTGA
ncbi:MAG: hypothetical protein U9P14_04225 [Gemmatimonadota bacterium]|nr:hypothetical protein [Gemmatimonadota bacterium]